MLTWKEFSDARPDLATVGASLLYEFGDLGLGFLATVRADGGPRVHPVCPMVTRQGLFAFVIPGPKLQVLRRDARYALHCETFPPPRHDDAFYLTGLASERSESRLRASLTEQFLRERHLEQRWPGFADQALVEFHIDRCLVTLTEPRDGLPEGHTIWHVGPNDTHP